ncbi:MAG: hypothetical protein QOE63_1727 [Acidimicrobiaceae bacterium]
MHFSVDQQIAADPGAVCAAFADAALYELLGELPKLGRPEVLDREQEGDVVSLRIRYAFNGELNAAARAAIDPAKLTWVEESTHDLAARTVVFRLVPDHYRDRFSCSGSYRFAPSGAGTVRHAEGDLKVKAMLVGRLVEEAIVSGLREHLDDEVPMVERFIALRGRGPGGQPTAKG